VLQNMCGFFPNLLLYSNFASLYMRASTRGSFIQSTLTAPCTKRRRHFFGFGSNQNMTESAVVTHTGTKTFKLVLSLFSSGSRHRFPLPSFILFLRLLMCPLSIVNSLLYYIKREQHSQRRMVLGNLPGNVAWTSELARDSGKTVRPTQ